MSEHRVHLVVTDNNHSYLALNEEPLRKHFNNKGLLNLAFGFLDPKTRHSSNLSICLNKDVHSGEIILSINAHGNRPDFRYVQLFHGPIKSFEHLVKHSPDPQQATENILVRDLQERVDLSQVCLDRDARRYLTGLVETHPPDFAQVPLSLIGADPLATPIEVPPSPDDDEDEDHPEDFTDEDPF